MLFRYEVDTHCSDYFVGRIWRERGLFLRELLLLFLVCFHLLNLFEYLRSISDSGACIGTVKERWYHELLASSWAGFNLRDVALALGATWKRVDKGIDRWVRVLTVSMGRKRQGLSPMAAWCKNGVYEKSCPGAGSHPARGVL